MANRKDQGKWQISQMHLYVVVPLPAEKASRVRLLASNCIFPFGISHCRTCRTVRDASKHVKMLDHSPLYVSVRSGSDLFPSHRDHENLGMEAHRFIGYVYYLVSWGVAELVSRNY